MSILFAVQSLKGTLNSVDAARIAEEELEKVQVMPVTDGGNGFLNTVSYYRPNGSIIHIPAVNANGSRIQCSVLEYNDSVFIESADIIGEHRTRKCIPLTKRSTYGIGIVLNYALKMKKRVYIGLGGSYTADMGFGMLKAMGYDVSAYEGTSVLRHVYQCKKLSSLSIIPDVKNTLEGSKGAIEYVRQKHASDSEIKKIRSYFNKTACSIDMKNTMYAGAAGGLGAACMLAGADIINNMDFMDSISDIRGKIDKAHTIITSEGMIDRQSFYGKITGEIIHYALDSGKRVIVIAGKSCLKRNDIEIYLMGQAGMNEPAKVFRNTLRKMRKEL